MDQLQLPEQCRNLRGKQGQESMAEKFKVGDTVKVVMTIEKIHPNRPRALCSWSAAGRCATNKMVFAC